MANAENSRQLIEHGQLFQDHFSVHSNLHAVNPPMFIAFATWLLTWWVFVLMWGTHHFSPVCSPTERHISFRNLVSLSVTMTNFPYLMAGLCVGNYDPALKSLQSAVGSLV